MTSPSWPPESGLTTKVVPRKDAVLQVYSSQKISAPASLVWKTVLNVGDYKSWNTWIPTVRIVEQNSAESDDHETLRQNTVFIFHVIMDANKPASTRETQLEVTDISTPERPTDYVDTDMLQDPSFTADRSSIYRVAWASPASGLMSKVLRNERFHEILPTGANACEVRTWEVMGGPMAYTVKWFFQTTLQAKFELWTRDLKAYCERQAGEASV